jgi:HSP20 family protein
VPKYESRVESGATATEPPTPRIMPTRRPTLLPLIEAPLPTNTPNPSFALPPFVRASAHHTTVSPKYDLIELPDAFCLHGELAGVEKDDIEIEFTDSQTMSIRGYYKRCGIPPIGLVEGSMGRSFTTKNIKVSSRHEIVEDKRAIRKETCTATLQPPQAKEKYWLSERSIGQFSRSFEFHVLVDQDHIQASIKNGLLSIVVPKAEEFMSCKVTIS